MSMQQKMIVPQARQSAHIHALVSKKPVNVDSIEAMTAEKDKLVTGTFVNVECQGQTGTVCGKYYRGMQYFYKVFEDGERATIPLSVARWINERSGYEQHSYILDDQGNPMKTGKRIPRYKFTSEF